VKHLRLIFPIGFTLALLAAAAMLCVFGSEGQCRPNLPDTQKPQAAAISWTAQLVVMLSGLVIKPVYMALSVLIILFLWRQKSRDLVLLRWSMILFFLGEAFCAATYLFASGDFDFFEILHGLGMVGLGAFLPWGMVALFDDRVVRVTNQGKQCALQRLCKQCWKQKDVSCGLKRIFLFVASAFAVIALMPLTSPLNPTHIILQVFGSSTHFKFSLLVQIFELRIYPLLASALMLYSLLPLRGGLSGIQRAQLPFFAGLGFMLYSLFRFFLLTGYRGLPQWINFWEELTELITVIGMGVFLILFRRQLNLTIRRTSS